MKFVISVIKYPVADDSGEVFVNPRVGWWHDEQIFQIHFKGLVCILCRLVEPFYTCGEHVMLV
ncbi:hypothetical protein Plhal304r1_c013g0048601 [Plasmopara halstedii]